MLRWMMHRGMWSAMRAPFHHKQPQKKQEPKPIPSLPIEKWAGWMFLGLVVSIIMGVAIHWVVGVAMFIEFFCTYKIKTRR